MLQRIDIYESQKKVSRKVKQSLFPVMLGAYYTLHWDKNRFCFSIIEFGSKCHLDQNVNLDLNVIWDDKNVNLDLNMNLYLNMNLDQKLICI